VNLQAVTEVLLLLANLCPPNQIKQRIVNNKSMKSTMLPTMMMLMMLMLMMQVTMMVMNNYNHSGVSVIST